MRLSKRQIQIVLGTLLGDGYLYKNGRLQVEHSSKDLDYLQWKYKALLSIASGLPKQCIRRDSRTNKTYTSWRFYTKPLFKSLRSIFYPKTRKAVPRDEKRLNLDPLGLAVWFRDDGGRGARTLKGMIISVRGYTKKERRILKQYLERRFKISVNVHKNDQLYFPVATVDRFCKIIHGMEFQREIPTTENHRKLSRSDFLDHISYPQ